MPLSDLVRTLNANHRQSIPGIDPNNPFVATAAGVVVHYAGLRLASRFLPYVEAASGQVLGHAAELVAHVPGRQLALAPEGVFALPTEADELVYLDRLVRTLHALNYLLVPAQGRLIVKVHPRHIASVPEDHGLAFEEIIRPCGLVPAQITLEIRAQAGGDQEHLQRAIASYRSRGYGIALGHFGSDQSDLGLLETVRPDIARLHPALIASGRPLARLLEHLHRRGALSMAEAREPTTPLALSRLGGIDLLTKRQPSRRQPHASAPTYP